MTIAKDALPIEQRAIADLKPHPRNPRGIVVVNDSLRELAASIKSQGLLQPILITPDGTIIAGHRRAKAAELIELETVDVIVREMSEIQQIEVMLVENLHRADLNVVQEGKAYLALEGFGLTLAQISERVGICVQTIKTRTAVASLPSECHEAFASGQLPVGCAERLLPLPKAKQVYWVTRAVKEKWRGNQMLCEIGRASFGEKNVVIPTPEEVKREKLNGLIERLEKIEKELDQYGDDFELAQGAIREASILIVDTMVMAAKTKRAA